MRSFLGRAGVSVALSLAIVSGLDAQQSRLSVTPPAASPAQSGGTVTGIAKGYTDLGFVVGLGGIAGASVALGGRFEHMINDLPDMGDGILGINVGVDWYHYSNFYGGWTYMPIGVTANYHFNMQENKKFDPFIGFGLGDLIASAPSLCAGCNYDSGLYFIGKVGMRYFVNNGMAIYADAGSGYGAIHVGLTWKLGG